MTNRITLLLFIGLAWGQPTTIAVFDLENNGLKDSEISILTERLQSELVKVGGYTVVERKKIEKVFEEQKFQMSGCVEECLIEIGMLLGAKEIVIGSAGRFGSTYTISARLVNAATGEVLKSANYDHSGDIAQLLIKGMKELAYELATNTSPLIKSRRIDTIDYKATIEKIFIEEGDFTRSGFGNPLNINIIVYQDLNKIIHIKVGKKRGLIGINKSESLSFNPKSIYKIRVVETDAIISKYYDYSIPSKNGEWPFDKEKILFGRKSYIDVGQEPPFPIDETKYPIYRFLHRTYKEHFYTKNSNPKGDWIAEGIEFYAYKEKVEGTVPIYRFLHNSYNDHFYTRSSNPKGNWKHQGPEFYAYPASAEGTIPIYRYYSKVNRDHFYTTDSSAVGDYTGQGIEFYAFPIID